MNTQYDTSVRPWQEVGEADDDDMMEVLPEAQPPVWTGADISGAELLVVGMTTTSSTLLRTVLPGARAVAHIDVAPRMPERDEVSWGLRGSGGGERLQRTDIVVSQTAAASAPLVVALAPPVPLDASRAYAWAQLLIHKIQPTRVLILTTVDAMSIRADTLLESPTLRKVTTLLDRDLHDGVAFLEPPNIVQGAEAALLAHCELVGIRARLYMSVQDGHLASREAIAALTPLLTSNSLPWSSLLHPHLALPIDTSAILSKLISGDPNPLYL